MRVGLQALSLRLPTGHIGLQRIARGKRVLPWLGREHVNALGQQHCGFAVHLGLVLQVLHGFDALGQRSLQAGQGLA